MIRLRILGENFQPPTTVRLVRNGEQLVGKVIDQTATSLNANISLADATVGQWNLVVENASGRQGRLPEAFEVQQTVRSSDPDVSAPDA